MHNQLMQKKSCHLFFIYKFPHHGWIGLGLVVIFWTLNWTLPGARTQWIFFPLWLGYCLFVDALVLHRTGTSLLNRGRRQYIGMFLISAPVWWIFELINLRLQNWHYAGGELFTPLAFWFWATISFSTVIPAVFGSAELFASFKIIKRLGNGPILPSDGRAIIIVFTTGLVMFILMMIWPSIFFPFIWFSIYFIMEPINVWRGNRNLAEWTQVGNWRPVLALWMGVLLTAFFWEMWNYLSYPKWVYHVPWGNCCHVFEMPLLGYGGYLPFSLELFAIYHLIMGFLGNKKTDYIHLTSIN
jgi:hypothetical protein